MVESVFIDYLSHDALVFVWSPGSHEDEESPFWGTMSKMRIGRRVGPSIALS